MNRYWYNLNRYKQVFVRYWPGITGRTCYWLGINRYKELRYEQILLKYELLDGCTGHILAWVECDRLRNAPTVLQLALKTLEYLIW